MSRMKTFLKYVIWLVLFFIISEFLIAVGLNASYRDIERRDDLSQVQISQAQATLVNGRVKGTITNTQELGGTYVRFDFYSERDNVVGILHIYKGVCNRKKNLQRRHSFQAQLGLIGQIIKIGPFVSFQP